MARALVKTVSTSPEDLQAKGLQLGDIKESLLDEATFQSVHGTSWILADGRSITGTDLATLTGWTNAPDLRGVFLRGKDHGVGRNPDGDTALGTYQLDSLQGHEHNQIYTSGSNGSTTPGSGRDPVVGATAGIVTDGSNGTPRVSEETRSRNVTVNFFIKINEE
jgi:hypothetical protein